MSGDACIAQLLMLDAQDPSRDVKFFINSPGGQVTSGMGIYDTMAVRAAGWGWLYGRVPDCRFRLYEIAVTIMFVLHCLNENV